MDTFNLNKNSIKFLVGNYENIDQLASNVILQTLTSRYIFLPGGKTPETLFKIISKEINQKNIHVLPSDERLVPIDSENSNFKMLKKYFENVYQIYNPKLSNEEMGNSFNYAIKDLDISSVVIGCGEDGHIASLFPQNKKFEKEAIQFKSKNITKNLSAYSSYIKNIGWRCSLSLSYILKCKNTFLFVKGANKKKIVARLKNEIKTPVLPIDFLVYSQNLTIITDNEAYGQ